MCKILQIKMSDLIQGIEDIKAILNSHSTKLEGIEKLEKLQASWEEKFKAIDENTANNKKIGAENQSGIKKNSKDIEMVQKKNDKIEKRQKEILKQINDVNRRSNRRYSF